MKAILKLFISVLASGFWYCWCKANSILETSESIQRQTLPGIVFRRCPDDTLLMSAKNLNKSSSLRRSPSWKQTQCLNHSSQQYTKEPYSERVNQFSRCTIQIIHNACVYMTSQKLLQCFETVALDLMLLLAVSHILQLCVRFKVLFGLLT